MDDLISTVEKAEVENCAKDFVYFCEKYVKIHHPKLGLIPFILHGYQKRYIKALEDHRYVIAKKFRQGGFSTLTIVWLTWRLMFKPHESNMVCAKTDREAIHLGTIARQIINCLPDFLQPKLSKQNQHTLQYNELDSKLYFHTWAAACGRSINYLFIDEAAYIKDMEAHWKAIWPVLSTGGHAIVISTAYFAQGWFYDTYTMAEKRQNDFHVFRCHHWEHPEYRDDDWVKRTKLALGARGWRQEVLGEFISKDNKKFGQRLDDALEFFDEVTSAQEFVEQLTTDEAEIHKLEAETRRRFREAEEDWSIKSGEQPGLIWDTEEEPVTKPYETKETQEPTKPENDTRGYAFLPKTPEEIQRLLNEHEFYSKNVNHPVFNEIDISDPEVLSEFWSGVAELFPDYYQEISLNWKRHLRRKRRDQHKLEKRVFDWINPDMLAMAGIITSSEAKSMPGDLYGRPDVVILHNVLASKKFPEEMELEFDEGRLCVNGCPTLILEDDVRDLYNGTYALKSYDEAIQEAVAVLEQKLTVLFGATGDVDESLD